MADLEILRPEVHGLGPCKMCGATGYPMSFGGPDICPACDCGVNPDVTRLKRELAEARAELLRLAGDLNAARLSSETFEAKYRCMREEMCEVVNQAVCAERELAALKARIAGSSVVKIANYGDPFIVLPDHLTVPNSLKGKTVRLFVEE